MSERSRWTHSLCKRCWDIHAGLDQPQLTVIERRAETCCGCGMKHDSGIFVRGNPKEFRCKGEHAA